MNTSCLVSAPPPLATRLAQAKVVAAAAVVFTRLGFSAARVEDVLEAAGIARRTFYKYFRNKEDVLAALYELATTEILRAATAPDGADGLSAVRTTLDAYLDYHVENAALVRVLVEQAMHADSPLAPARRKFREGLVAVLDRAVRAATGEVHDPLLYAALVSALEGLSLDLLARGAPRDEVGRAKAVMHALLDRALRLGGRAPAPGP